jgi:hypothetical protein
MDDWAQARERAIERNKELGREREYREAMPFVRLCSDD